MDFIAIVERGSDGSVSAYLPDLPGCVACGDSDDELEASLTEAVRFHLESLKQHGEPIPKPSIQTITVHVE